MQVKKTVQHGADPVSAVKAVALRGLRTRPEWPERCGDITRHAEGQPETIGFPGRVLNPRE